MSWHNFNKKIVKWQVESRDRIFGNEDCQKSQLIGAEQEVVHFPAPGVALLAIFGCCLRDTRLTQRRGDSLGSGSKISRGQDWSQHVGNER
jgi:hypothetical protein